MIGDRIKNARKEKGLTQDELAARLHVVRQTVSKWESGSSAPDAELLVQLAQALEVTPDRLLGVQRPSVPGEDLAQELEKTRALLAEKLRQEARARQAGRARGRILSVAFVTALVTLSVPNRVLALVGLCVGCCTALALLYRALPLLTGDDLPQTALRPLRVTTVFDLLLLLLVTAVALLCQTGVLALSADGEKIAATALLSAVMLFGGYMAPKLPFNKHTGLRLPWTVQDEETWHLAHRVLGWLSLPLVLLYLGAVWALPYYFEVVTVAAVALWLGVPGLLSALFFQRKYAGR